MNRILIVEDEITISRLIAVSLRRAGYDCTVANDGSTAADLIAEHDFDLALLDIMLPGLGWVRAAGLPAPAGGCRSSLSRPRAPLRTGSEAYSSAPMIIS